MNNPKNNLNYVFVYGTLKEVFGNHHMLENSIPLGKATVKGHTNGIATFPGLLPKTSICDNRLVYGEVCIIDNDTLCWLDRLVKEGTRESTIARLDAPNCQDRHIAVWAYFSNIKNKEL